MNKILILLLTAATLLAQEAADTTLLRDKVLELEKKLASIKKKSRKEQERHNAYRQRVSKVMKTRNAELARLRSDLEIQENKWQQAKTQIQVLKRKSKEVDARFESINDVICGFSKALKQSIRTGFPAQQEKRISTLDILIRDIEQTGISSDEAFSRLWVIMDNEKRFGADIEVRTRDITLPSGVVTAIEELRIGRQALMYVSTDNKYYGLLKVEEKDGKKEYRWLTEGLDYSTRSAIRNAISVKTGKKPPRLVDIPIYVRHIKGGGK
jgi:hypothetical protein